MDRLRQNTAFVKSLCKKGDCGMILKKATPEQVKTLVDITLNIMKKRIPLSKKGVKFVISKRRELRHVLNPKYSLKSKKRFIVQKGGGIFAPLMSLLGRTGLTRIAGTAAGVGARAAGVAAGPMGRAGMSAAARGAFGRAAIASRGMSAAARTGRFADTSKLLAKPAAGRTGNLLKPFVGAPRAPKSLVSHHRVGFPTSATPKIINKVPLPKDLIKMRTMQHGSRTQLTQLPNKLAPAAPGQKILVKAQVHGPPGMQKMVAVPDTIVKKARFTNPTYEAPLVRSFDPKTGANIMRARRQLPPTPAAANTSKLTYASVGDPLTTSYQALATSTPLRAGVPNVGKVARLDTIQSMSSRGLDPSSAYTSLAKPSVSTGLPTTSRGMKTAGMQTEALTSYVKPMTSYRQFLEKKGFWNRFKFLAKRGAYEFLKHAPAMAVAGAVTAGVSAGVGHGVVKYLEARDKTPQVVIPPALQFDKPTTSTGKKSVKINESKQPVTRKRDYLASLGTRTNWQYDNDL